MKISVWIKELLSYRMIRKKSLPIEKKSPLNFSVREIIEDEKNFKAWYNELLNRYGEDEANARAKSLKENHLELHSKDYFLENASNLFQSLMNEIQKYYDERLITISQLNEAKDRTTSVYNGYYNEISSLPDDAKFSKSSFSMAEVRTLFNYHIAIEKSLGDRKSLMEKLFSLTIIKAFENKEPEVLIKEAEILLLEMEQDKEFREKGGPQLERVLKVLIDKNQKILELQKLSKQNASDNSVITFKTSLSEDQINQLYDVLASNKTEKCDFRKLFTGHKIEEVKGKICFEASNRLLAYTFVRMIKDKSLLNYHTRYQNILVKCMCQGPNGKITSNALKKAVSDVINGNSSPDGHLLIDNILDS